MYDVQMITHTKLLEAKKSINYIKANQDDVNKRDDIYKHIFKVYEIMTETVDDLLTITE